MPASRQIRLLYPDFHSPALVSENSPQSMTPRFTYIRALCAFSCMLAQITLYSAPTAADESAITVKMDNKTIFIPETKLTQKNNPVTSFLYIGSWAGGGAARVSLCGIDVANNQIHINFPESLLENSTTRLLTQNDADAFLGKLSWGDRQATQVAFKVNSEQWQSITLEAFASAEVALFLNGKPAGYVNAGNIRAAGGRASFTVTPGRPPSRMMRLEQAPMVWTGMSGGRARRNWARSFASVGRISTSAGPPARNQVNGASGAFSCIRPRNGGRGSTKVGVCAGAIMASASRVRPAPVSIAGAV